MMNYHINLADALGANKAMIALIKTGKLFGSEQGLAEFESAAKYGECEVARAIENGNITRLDALQAEKRGADSVIKEFSR